MQQDKKIVLHSGDILLSTREAARALSCAPDYVSKLCREGKLKGVQVDGTWHVHESSLAPFQQARDRIKRAHRAELSELRKHERENKPQLPAGRLPRRVGVAFVLSGALLMGSVVLAAHVSSSAQTHFAVGKISSTFFEALPTPLAFPAKNIFPARLVASIGFVPNIFSTIAHWFAPGQTAHTFSAKFSVAPAASPSAVLAAQTHKTNFPLLQKPAGSNSVQNITYPVIEHTNTTKIIEHTTEVSGISEATLDAKLSALSSALSSELHIALNGSYGSFGVGVSNAAPTYASGGIQNSIALSQRIDNLSDVTITNATVHGLSGLTASDIPALDYAPLGSGSSSGGIADPFTHPAAGQSATTSLMLLFGNASTSQLTATSSVWFTGLGGTGGVGIDSAGKLYAYATTSQTSASSTLLGDVNTFSGLDSFTNASSNWGGTWQTFAPSHFQTALGFTATPNTRNINTTYPVQGGGDLSADRTLSLAFGTTTSNVWANTQTFTNPIVFSSLTSGGLAVDASGNVYKAATTTAGTGLSYSSNAFNLAAINAGVLGATTNGSAPTSQATSTLFGVGTGGQVLGWNNSTGGIAWVATSSASGGGIADPFTHPAAGQSATTSLMLLFGNASTSQLTATSSIWFTGLGGGGGLGLDTAGKLYAYATSSQTSASSTLLSSDANTFSGVNLFTNASSNWGGTWQTFSPAHFQVAGSYLTSAITSLGTGWATTTGPGVTFSTSTLNNGSNAFSITQSGTALSFNLPTASASVSGALSFADWSTFNGKQAAGNYLTALTGDVTASGPGSAAATLAMGNTHWWTALQNFTNASTSQLTATSSVYLATTGGSVGIGTTSPFAKLSVHANNGETNTTLFAIASSTASATTTLFRVDNAGGVFTQLGTPAGTFLAADPNGKIIATTTPVGGAGGGIADPFTHPANSQSATTSLMFLFGQASTSQLTATSTVWFTGIGSAGGLGLDTAGKLYAAATTTAGTGLSYSGNAFNVSGLTTAQFASANISQWTNNANYLTAALTSFGNGYASSTGPSIGIASSTIGTDFSITNSGSTFTFNFPTASASNRGLLSAVDWATFNGKVGLGTNIWTGLQQFSANASSTQFSATQAYFGGTATSTFTSAGFLGIGTSTPWAQLSINPTAINGSAPAFAIGSSTATWFTVANNGSTTVANSLTANNGNFFSDSVNGTTTIANFATGLLSFDLDAGRVTAFDLPLDSNQAAATPNSYDFSISGSTVATIYGENNGSGVLQNARFGIGTTTPGSPFAVTQGITSGQAAIAYDGTNYTQFSTNAVGNLVVVPSGNNIFFPNTNLFVCTGGSISTSACPTGTPTGQGNVIVQNKIGIASSTPFDSLSIGSFTGSVFGSIAVTENKVATSTSLTIDWTKGNQQLVQVAAVGITITFSNYIAGQKLNLLVCNGNFPTAGTITWPAGLSWPGGVAPGQTTTANQCDVWSFMATQATSTTGAVKIFGMQASGFQ